MSNTTPAAGAAPSSEQEQALSFDQLPLSAELRQALQDMGYTEPMAVQLATWEPAVAGRDVVIQARTGTGKTAAFGMPIVDRLIRRSQQVPQALVLCPTRELALQVAAELTALSKYKNVTITAIYGGAPIGRQLDALGRGVQVIVGTPGRVLDHLRRKTLDPAAIRMLVLDEADEMLSMGFEKELSAIIERLPEDRQTTLLSATIPPDIERLARTRLQDPEFLILSSDAVGAKGIAHSVYLVTENKLGALVHVLDVEDPESAIIFCNTRSQTEKLAQHLTREGFQADWLNGDLPQSEREKVMRATKEGRLRFLVATDVAARGIDISHLTHVINYDFPQDAEGYIHRTGRTGRAGRTGTALSLVTPQDIGALYILRLTYKIRPLERHLPTSGEKRTRFETDVVQSLVKAFAPRGRQSEHLALARRLLADDEAEAVIAGMLREHLLSHPDLAEGAGTRRRQGHVWQARGSEPQAARPHRPRAAGARKPRRSEPWRQEPHRPEPRRAPPRPEGEAKEQPTAPAAPAAGGTADELHELRDEDIPSEPVRGHVRRPSRSRRTTADESAGAAGQEAEPELRVRAHQHRSAKSTVDGPRAEPLRSYRRGAPETAPPAEAAPPETASAEAAPDAQPPPEAAPPEPASPDDPAEAAPDAQPPQRAGADGEAAGVVELHVNAGKRHGAHAGDIKKIFQEGGLEAALKRVRVRERYCFVEVAVEAVEASLALLNAAQVGSKPAQAAISERSAGPLKASPTSEDEGAGSQDPSPQDGDPAE